jgi:uncharacterized repeat protein (TIGR01451 family)
MTRQTARVAPGRRSGTFSMPIIVMILGAAIVAGGCAARHSARGKRVQGPEVARQDGMSRDVLAFPTGDRKTSVLLVEKIAPEQIRVKQPYEYQIRATNLTDGPLLDVVIRERLADRETFELTSSEPAFKTDGDWVQYPLGTLAPRETRTIKVTGETKKEGTITSVIAIAAEFKAGIKTEAQVVNPILKLTKEGPETADLCEGIRYRYVISNVGTGTERDVVIEEALPEGLVTSDGQKTVKIMVGDLPQSHSRSFEARVKSDKTGTFSSAAVARAPGGAEVRSETVTTKVQQPKLDVTISGPATEYLNKTAVYEVTVKNVGPVAAPRTALAIDAGDKGALAMIRATEVRNAAGERMTVPPAEAEVASASVRPIVAAEIRADAARRERSRDAAMNARREGTDLGTLAPGESRTFTVTVLATREGQMSISAICLASCVVPVTAIAKTDVKTLAELTTDVVDLDDPIKIGDDVVYRITVTNVGTGADKNISVTAALPSGMQFVEAEGATEGMAQGQNVAFGNLPTLGPGQDATWRIRAKANTAGDVRLEVRVKSDTLKQPAVETEPTKLY